MSALHTAVGILLSGSRLKIIILLVRDQLAV